MMLFMASALQFCDRSRRTSYPTGAMQWFTGSAGHPVDAAAGAFDRSVVFTSREGDLRREVRQYGHTTLHNLNSFNPGTPPIAGFAGRSHRQRAAAGRV